MKNKILFRFSHEVESFSSIVKFFYDEQLNMLSMTLPIRCYYGNFSERENTFLFKTTFTTNINSLADIASYYQNFHYWDVEAYFEKHFPKSDFLSKLEVKGTKWIGMEKPNPIEIVETQIYKSGTEFIECDEETNFYGNFQQEGKEGCHLRFGVNSHCRPFDVSFVPFLSEYHLPAKFKNVKSMYGMSNKEKTTYLLSFGLTTALDVYRKAFRETNVIENIDCNFCPFEIRVGGNDDESWSRYFTTEEDMMAEVYRLRRCQPINKEMDIKNNGYHFTN